MRERFSTPSQMMRNTIRPKLEEYPGYGDSDTTLASLTAKSESSYSPAALDSILSSVEGMSIVVLHVREFPNSDKVSPTACGTCDMPQIMFGADGVVWCGCKMKAIDREIAANAAELRASLQRATELETRGLEQEETCRRLEHDLRRCREQAVSVPRNLLLLPAL